MSKMKIIPLIVLVVIIVGTITLSLPIISNQISPDKSINKTERATLLSYTPHSPITIATDADFSSQGWPGNGTKGNPYLIEGLNITSSSTCISISDTRVYFEIRNCLISSISASVNTGIYLYNVTSGVLDSCRIDSHNVGVDLYWSHNCRLNNKYSFSLMIMGIYADEKTNK